MLKRSGRWILAAAAFLAVSGCATTRSTHGEFDSLNARIASLEGQISEKDSEIARLRNQMRNEESARAQAENEKRSLREKLEAALAQKESRTTGVADSDLK